MEEYRNGYDKFRASLCLSDPRLRESLLSLLPPPSGTWVPWARTKARVLALRLGSNGIFESPVVHTSASSLATDLNKRQASTMAPSTTPQAPGAAAALGDSSRVVYLLEGLCPDFISVLGTHFQLHPSLFVDHERLVPAVGRLTGEGEGIPFLPSAILGRDHVALKYHESLQLHARPTSFRNLCDTSGRHIAVTRLIDEFSDVAICRRKCTFWSKTRESGGWTCLIICDPPIRRVLNDYSGHSGTDIVTSPYGSGYLDFMPLSDQIETRCGPPRSSLLDDLLFYLQKHSTALGCLDDPKTLRIFVDKIVASHFLKLAEFLQTNVDIVHWHLSRRQDLTSFNVSASEALWSEVQSWQRRVAEYQDDLVGIMLQLGIPSVALSAGGHLRSWTDSTADFQYLLHRYHEIGRRTQALSDAISALGNLAGNRSAARSAELLVEGVERAARENRTIKALTILGMVFLPLSFAASLLSMSEAYLPGSSMFWVYFAVSLPIIGLVVLVYFVVEVGFTNPTSRWSITAAIINIKAKILGTQRTMDQRKNKRRMVWSNV